ncbi:hypothetical protein P3S67_029019 [Capsicum chacoense]
MYRNKKNEENLDRFIPNRSAMDFDYAHYMLSGGKVKKEHVGVNSSSYLKLLAQELNMNRTRILAFKNKPPPSAHRVSQSPSHIQQVKKRRYIPQSAERTLEAPDIPDDFCLNLLDWGSSNVIAIGLGNSVYLWDASDGSTTELLTLWDTLQGSSQLLMRMLRGHRLRVHSLDWNGGHILTTGGMDSMIFKNDVRVRSHVVGKYRGHTQEICGLKWSESCQQLASGGNDNLVHIWSLSICPPNNSRQWIHYQHESELLSSHGFTDNQLTVWKYSSMTKISELFGHTSRVLHMAQSPDGYTVATVAADETLRLWNGFGNPEENNKPVLKRKLEPFFDLIQISREQTIEKNIKEWLLEFKQKEDNGNDNKGDVFVMWEYLISRDSLWWLT